MGWVMKDTFIEIQAENLPIEGYLQLERVSFV
jgi:hypothetical protein